jgi:hypothetical protein
MRHTGPIAPPEGSGKYKVPYLAWLELVKEWAQGSLLSGTGARAREVRLLPANAHSSAICGVKDVHGKSDTRLWGETGSLTCLIETATAYGSDFREYLQLALIGSIPMASLLAPRY